ncbi:MAG TPA: CoA transferase, partial [Brevibacterium sp.]|nr:CoA transferase [Brevibacterium sp.]
VDGPIGTDRKLTAADPRTGHAYLGHPLLVDGTRPASTLPAPRLGEHNADFATAESTSSVAAPESAEPNN